MYIFFIDIPYLMQTVEILIRRRVPAASNLDLHCFPMLLLWDVRQK